MATFYVLPPRTLLVQHLLTGLGVTGCPASDGLELAEAVARAMEATGVYVVYRDDLPPHTDISQSIADGFGAETGDEVIDVSLDGPPSRRRLVLPPLAA